jgi:hypothetical protein
MGLRIKKVGLLAGLLAVGLLAASPFLTDRMLGTSEAFNYSLSVSDAVTQMRAGVMPPLAGQTVYAFNGRIHPLRNAPYLHYLAYALDLATGHRLPLWRLMTVSLVLSIIAAVFACYLGLRWGIGCPRLPAFLLSTAYGLSAPLMCAAYTYDMYMTVHAAVFVPLAIGACLRGCLRPSFSVDAWLAAALAGAWLAHPPVALWLTASVVLVRLIVLVQNPSWRVVASGACALLLAACLACFVFVSTSSLGFPLAAFSGSEGYRGMAGEIIDNVRAFFPGTLKPISATAGLPGDLQVGYVPWILFLLTLAGLLRGDWRRRIDAGPIRSAAVAVVAAILVLMVTVIPMPGLTQWIWLHLPPGVLNLTNIWPNQRIYLVAVPFMLFGAAIVLPRAFSGVRFPRWALALAVGIGLSWTLYQAEAFISRGKNDRWTEKATSSAYRPSNLDLTVTSYAFIQVPQSFVYGVADPQIEFRLLRNGTDEIDSPLAAGLADAPVVDHGSIRSDWFAPITLQPGKRYLLTFNFHTSPVEGAVQLLGPLLYRRYALPSAGNPRAFGMLPGQRRTLSVWTDGDTPERVEISFTLPTVTKRGPGTVFADYTLQEVVPSRLPIRFQGYLPFRFSVDSPEYGCTVETPQRYLPGYEATVNGQRETVLTTPDRQVMVPVPKGRSEVVLVYRGPVAARIAFWFCAWCWVCFAGWRLCGSWLPQRPFSGVVGAYRFILRHRVSLGSAAVVIILVAVGVSRYERMISLRRAVGPIAVDFTLPFDGASLKGQPLLATGKPGAGAVVFLNAIDNSHLRLLADVWGQLFQSEPIETDFTRDQELIVSDSALFPKDNTKVQALPPAEASRLRGELRVELDGRTAILEKCDAYETTQAETLAGRTNFGSFTAPLFQGTILGVRRLPIPRVLALPWGRHVHMNVRFPEERVGATEPLLSGTADGRTCSFYVTYLSDARLRFANWTSDKSPVQYVEVTIDPKSSHALDFYASESSRLYGSFGMCCTLDGAPLFGTPGANVIKLPALISAGLNTANVPGVLERFTGPQMDVETPGSVAAPEVAASTGPIHLVVSLPQDKAGHSEPLVTTGKTGAGDLVYVSYIDPTHIRIALDHWGGSGAVSDLIPIDYKAPHEIWISMASLQGSAAPVTVMLDGAVVLSSPIATYPSTPAEVTVAQNTIGGSSAEAAFSGTLQFVERLGDEPVPKPGS